MKNSVKKNTVMKNIIRVSLLAVLAAALVLSLCGCSGPGVEVGPVYGNAGKYTAGDAVLTDPVDSIDVEWSRGNVELAYSEGSEITLSEQSETELTDEIRLHWWVDGSTLRVHYAASGQIITGKLEKNLTLTLPAGLSLSSLKISATSGEVNVQDTVAESVELNVSSGMISAGLQADDVKLDSTSGTVSVNVNARNTVEINTTSGKISATVQAGEIKAESTSGRVSLTQSGASDKIELHTTSGNIEAVLDTVGTVKASSTSGSVSLQGKKIQKAEAGCTSGTITFSADETPQRLILDSTSGDLRIYLPADASFTAEVDQTSGDFFYEDFALKKQEDHYIAGDGNASLSLHSTSGDIRLNAAK